MYHGDSPIYYIYKFRGVLKITPDAHQQCSLGTGPCPCQRRIFPSWHITFVAAECAELVEYDASVLPKSSSR
jgi:hypothetical protein